MRFSRSGGKMKVATILFTYNRIEHTKETLDALKQNTFIPEKLYVFQDGAREEPKEDWMTVNKLIHSIDWCDKEIIVSDVNKGLAKSIVDGVNYAFQDNDAVIVLEDDCVPHPIFMKFMLECLEKYKDEKSVFSINGSSDSWPSNIEDNGTDIYFAGRAGSWGWATWKDRWELYEQDYLILKQIKKEERLAKQLHIWGQDLEAMLKGNIDGYCDSWAVFWALQCIKQEGFCPTPYRSLIKNIGNDGTGVHCGNVELLTNTRDWDDLSEIVLPDTIEYPPNCEEVFADRFRWTSPETRLRCYNRILHKWNMLLQKKESIKNYFKERKIHTIAIWGKGDICKLILQELSGEIKISQIIESQPITSEYLGIPIVGTQEITDEIECIVVIPTFDMDGIKKKVSAERLIIGIDEILDILLNECNGGGTNGGGSI